ncbi:hypothetical protein BJ986_001757 [Phycicoccus badiiscoriae]|uniref:Uncharacterized protein n=1 Tax=Pedococcus badiiscoriae TaxID=642776 RepID=A0A852WEU2_9MICO|nr:hypothetical protein [Pedococcus badiiscoriae]NYG07270.1 hypothetical protein [Pedococcus badiiscoriae]
MLHDSVVVPADYLDDLAVAVERLQQLGTESEGRVQGGDPIRLLDALCAVYAASQRLVEQERASKVRDETPNLV